MSVEETTLAAVHRKLAAVNGEVAGALARRRFSKSRIPDWKQNISEAVTLLTQLEK